MLNHKKNGGFKTAIFIPKYVLCMNCNNYNFFVTNVNKKVNF